jgi:hypothetical protein
MPCYFILSLISFVTTIQRMVEKWRFTKTTSSAFTNWNCLFWREKTRKSINELSFIEYILCYWNINQTINNKWRKRSVEWRYFTFHWDFWSLLQFQSHEFNWFLIFDVECWKLSVSIWKEVVFERWFQSNKGLQCPHEDKLFTHNHNVTEWTFIK